MNTVQLVPSLTVGLAMLFASGTLAGEETPRLKFRDRGPACMCAGGLSEEDIRRAERRRRPAAGEFEDSRTDSSNNENVGIDRNRRGDQ